MKDVLYEVPTHTLANNPYEDISIFKTELKDAAVAADAGNIKGDPVLNDAGRIIKAMNTVSKFERAHRTPTGNREQRRAAIRKAPSPKEYNTALKYLSVINEKLDAAKKAPQEIITP